jgi:hypothetical protein
MARSASPNQDPLRALNTRLYPSSSPFCKSTDPFARVGMQDVADWNIPSYPRPVMKYKRDLEVDTEETDSGEMVGEASTRRVVPLEYRITGMTWYSARYYNSCNLDSFLSAFVRKIRQNHGDYLRHIVIMDPVGVILIKIGDYALRHKESVDADHVKILWLNVILRRTNEHSVLRRDLVDLVGNSRYSILQHLYLHLSVEIKSKCLCGTLLDKDFLIDVPSLAEIRTLGDPATLGNARMPKCSDCNVKRELIGLNPVGNNWCVAFVFNGTGRNRDPKLADVPINIIIGNLKFKLEYLTYNQLVPGTQGCAHEVSIHLIRGEWYLHNGLTSPKFQKWNEPDYTVCNARLTTLIYFKDDKT